MLWPAFRPFRHSVNAQCLLMHHFAFVQQFFKKLNSDSDRTTSVQLLWKLQKHCICAIYIHVRQDFKTHGTYSTFLQSDLLASVRTGACFLAKLLSTSRITFSIASRTSELKERKRLSSSYNLTQFYFAF